LCILIIQYNSDNISTTLAAIVISLSSRALPAPYIIVAKYLDLYKPSLLRGGGRVRVNKKERVREVFLLLVPLFGNRD
jgi:hypothetical protein